MVDEYGMDVSPATYTLAAITEVIFTILQNKIKILITAGVFCNTLQNGYTIFIDIF